MYYIFSFQTSAGGLAESVNIATSGTVRQEILTKRNFDEFDEFLV